MKNREDPNRSKQKDEEKWPLMELDQSTEGNHKE
jgi:hypothetical protein